MKKQLLFAFSIAAFGLASAQTINKEDLKLTIGNEWRMTVDNVNSAFLDLATGTGKTWDFSGYTGANGYDTVKVQSSTVADIKVKSTILNTSEYKATSTNYTAATISGFTLDNPNSLDMGLPHTQGKTWNATGSTMGGFLSIALAGSVPASGTIKLPWGTFNCVLVKEVTSGSISSTVYHWETVEHGRVASYNGTKLSVMQSTNFTTSTRKVSAQGFSVFPNPANSVINITADNGGTVKIFNALGNVVKQVNHTGGQIKVDVAGLTDGMYFVQLTTDKGVLTKSIVIK